MNVTQRDDCATTKCAPKQERSAYLCTFKLGKDVLVAVERKRCSGFYAESGDLSEFPCSTPEESIALPREAKQKKEKWLRVCEESRIAEAGGKPTPWGNRLGHLSMGKLSVTDCNI